MVRQRQRHWLVGLIGVGLLATATSMLPAKPGIVRTKDGTVYRGDVTEDEKFVTIKDRGIATRIDKRNIPAGAIQYTASIDDQFNERHAALAPNDIKGRMDLANWATQNERPDLAVTALEEATKIEPTNRDAALALDTAQRQVELDQRKKGAGAATPPPPPPGPGAKPGTTPPPPATRGVASQPAAAAPPGPGGKQPPMEHRLLNADEINTIRQKEMLAGDPKVIVQFKNDVVKKYLATGARNTEGFRKESQVEQAIEILDHGDPKLANDVRIMTDPSPIVDFKQKVYPVVATSCASTACHGGTKAGNFGLFPGQSEPALYTNFYILQTYAKTINGTQYLMMDRQLPERSLFLQYAVPASESEVSHPQAPNFRPRFRTKTDAGYKAVLDFLKSTLNPISPNYGIKVAPSLPATQPAADAPK